MTANEYDDLKQFIAYYESSKETTMTNGTTLLPCPLCHKTDTLTISDCQEVEDCRHFDKCENDTFKIVVCSVNQGGCGASSGYKISAEAAIEAWNTRYEPTCKPIAKYLEDSTWPILICSECGRALHYDMDDNDDYELQPYCGCGAKVIEE